MPGISAIAAALSAVRQAAATAASRLRRSDVGSRFVHGAAWTLAGVAASRSVMLLVWVAAARLLGKETFGQLGAARSSAAMMTALAGFGLGLAASKHVAQFRASQPERAARIIRFSTWTAVLTGLAAAALLWLGAASLAARLQAPLLAPLLRWSAALVLLECVQGTQMGALAGLEAFRSIARINVLVSLVSAPLIVLGAWRAGAAGAILGMTVAVAVHVLLNGWALRRRSRTLGLPARAAGWLREWRTLVGFSLPTALSGALVAPVDWFCCAMLVQASGGFGEFGVYAAANQWRMALLFVARNLSVVSLPLLAELHAEGELRRFAKLIRVNCLVVGLATAALAAPVILSAPWIMRCYGEGFADGALTLCLLAAAATLMSISFAVGQAWLSMGQVWRRLGLHVVWAAAAVGGTAGLLQWWPSSRGLAGATLAAFALHVALQSLCLRRVLRAASSPSSERQPAPDVSEPAAA